MSQQGGSDAHLQVSISIDTSPIVEDLRQAIGPAAPGAMDSEVVREMKESIAINQQQVAALQTYVEQIRGLPISLQEDIGTAVQRMREIIQEYRPIFERLYPENLRMLEQSMDLAALSRETGVATYGAELGGWRATIDIFNQILVRMASGKVGEQAGFGAKALVRFREINETLLRQFPNLAAAIGEGELDSETLHRLMATESRKLLEQVTGARIFTEYQIETAEEGPSKRLDMLIEEMIKGERVPTEAIEFKTGRMKEADFRDWFNKYLDIRKGLPAGEMTREQIEKLTYTFIAPGFQEGAQAVADRAAEDAMKAAFGAEWGGTTPTVRLIAYEETSTEIEGISLSQLVLESVSEFRTENPDVILDARDIMEVYRAALRSLIEIRLMRGRGVSGYLDVQTTLKKSISEALGKLPKGERRKGRKYADIIGEHRAIVRDVQKEQRRLFPDREEWREVVGPDPSRRREEILPSDEASRRILERRLFFDPAWLGEERAPAVEALEPRVAEEELPPDVAVQGFIEGVVEAAEKGVVGEQLKQIGIQRVIPLPDGGYSIQDSSGDTHIVPEPYLEKTLKELAKTAGLPLEKPSKVVEEAGEIPRIIKETGKEKRARITKSLLDNWDSFAKEYDVEALEKEYGVESGDREQLATLIAHAETPELMDLGLKRVHEFRREAELVEAAGLPSEELLAPDLLDEPEWVAAKRLTEREHRRRMREDPEYAEKVISGLGGMWAEAGKGQREFEEMKAAREAEGPIEPSEEWEGFETPGRWVGGEWYGLGRTRAGETPKERVAITREISEFITKLKKEMEGYEPGREGWIYLDGIKQKAGIMIDLLLGKTDATAKIDERIDWESLLKVG